jgi:hypothetical protein
MGASFGEPMDDRAADFLSNVISTLGRLQGDSAEHGETMLAFLLDLAKTEAEDRLRQAGLDADMRATLRDTSTVGFLGDIGRPRETPASVEAREADLASGGPASTAATHLPEKRRGAQRRRARTAS